MAAHATDHLFSACLVLLLEHNQHPLGRSPKRMSHKSVAESLPALIVM